MAMAARVHDTREPSLCEAEPTRSPNKSGWFELRLSGTGLPDPVSYALAVTYTGTQEL